MSSPSDAHPAFPVRRARAPQLLAMALAAAALAMPAHALYKVVGPDGKVTYTDRPPSGADGKVTPLTATGSALATDPADLPLELRQAVARYPVTLYVVADCEPCDSARALLRQRGIPYAERIVVSDADADALLRLTGTRDLPTMAIGVQHLRGFSADIWSGYLDSAGYPRESRLPAAYQYPAATPLTQRAAPGPAQPPSAPTTRAAPASPSGIRF
jgi:glutaredoxin